MDRSVRDLVSVVGPPDALSCRMQSSLPSPTLRHFSQRGAFDHIHTETGPGTAA